MTTNAVNLHDTLTRRIAHGGTTPRDLPLLHQLLACQRRRCLLTGAAFGIGLALVLQGIAVVAV